MASFHHWNTVAHSFCLSLAAVTGATVFQGSLLFRNEIAAVSDPWPCAVGRVTINTGQGSAVVEFTVLPPLGAAHRHLAGVYDLTVRPPAFKVLGPQVHSRRAITASGGQHAFISTMSGHLYSLDLAARSTAPVLLGKQDFVHADVLECAPDSSIVVVGSQNVTMAWHRVTRRLLWLRTDLCILCGAISMEPPRLICGTQAGEELELDLHSGVTLRTIATRECVPFALAVSPCSRYLASLDYARHLVITDLDVGQILWSRPSVELVGPKFSSDGKSLIVAHSSRSEQLAIHCAVTGRILGRLNTAAEAIKGLAVSDDGKVYAWDVEMGAITAWDLVSGAIVCRLFPERDWNTPR